MFFSVSLCQFWIFLLTSCYQQPFPCVNMNFWTIPWSHCWDSGQPSEKYFRQKWQRYCECWDIISSRCKGCFKDSTAGWNSWWFWGCKLSFITSLVDSFMCFYLFYYLYFLLFFFFSFLKLLHMPGVANEDYNTPVHQGKFCR